MSMNPHYKRGDGDQPPATFHLYEDNNIFGVIFEERDYSDVLRIFQIRCEEFDSEYDDSAIAPTRKFSISLLQAKIKAVDRLLEHMYLHEQRDDMRPEFIHHTMKYMRFELKLLGQKLTQREDDVKMTRALLLRQTFYRKHMSVMQNELAMRAQHQLAGRAMTIWKKSDDYFLEPDPTETAENLNWLHQQTLHWGNASSATNMPQC